MFGGTGGYFWLDSWILANIVQLGTQQFCRQFLSRKNDPGGRQYDQMTQSARSACANIAEGSARRKTSKETEMRLTDVARSSLAELSCDYLNWLLQKGTAPWPKNTPQARQVYDIWLDKPEYGQDVVHDACQHILAQKGKFDRWLESGDDEMMANCQLILAARVINMLNNQLESQGEVFERDGGFTEKLTDMRLNAKAEQENGPSCPECGRPMIRRLARKGQNKGRQFWGCTGYPECKGVRDISGNDSAKKSRESN